MIIFEGADLTGKTTAACDLSNDMGLVYQHLGKFPNHARMDTPTRLRFYVSQLTYHEQVRDRWALSDLAYRWADGSMNFGLTPQQYQVLDIMLRGAGAQQIVLTADPELIAERYTTRASEEKYPLDIVQRANLFYRVLLRWNPLHRDALMTWIIKSGFATTADAHDLVDTLHEYNPQFSHYFHGSYKAPFLGVDALTKITMDWARHNKIWAREMLH